MHLKESSSYPKKKLGLEFEGVGSLSPAEGKLVP